MEINGKTILVCDCESTMTVDGKALAKALGGDDLAVNKQLCRAQIENFKDSVAKGTPLLVACTQEAPLFLETRAEAERLGLAVADKPDSQDICFVPDGDYAAVVEKMRPGAVEPGEIVDQGGNVLGPHDGIINYTIGQRRGLNIGGGDPLYVVRLEPESKRVVVGPKEALLQETVSINEVNWLGDEPLGKEPLDVTVKIRSMTPLLPAKIRLKDDNIGEVILYSPYSGVAPGQACVMYDKERVLGGGWICK